MERSNMANTKEMSSTMQAGGGLNTSKLSSSGGAVKVVPGGTSVMGQTSNQSYYGSRQSEQQPSYLQKQEKTLQEQVYDKQISTVEQTRLLKVFDLICGNDILIREQQQQQQQQLQGNYDQSNTNHAAATDSNYRKNYFTAKDVIRVLEDLKYECTQSEVDKMIWEVDDNLDYQIDYHEFILMYKRCRFDDTGLEPRTLYNLVLFLMFLKSELKNESSEQEEKQEQLTITEEDTLELLYVRYGRHNLDKEIEEIFGKDEIGQQKSSQEKEINLRDFLEKQRKRDFQMRQQLQKTRKTVKLPDKQEINF